MYVIIQWNAGCPPFTGNTHIDISPTIPNGWRCQLELAQLARILTENHARARPMPWRH